MQRTVPNHAPLVAGLVACHTCGTLLKPIIIKGRSGVTTIRYECRNAATGCSYRVDTNTYLSAEVMPIRPDEKK